MLPFKREIKSFVKRHRRLTSRQEAIFSHYGAPYIVPFSNDLLDFEVIFERFAPIVLEIGFGHGESLWQMAKRHPENNYLGVEVHAPGVAALLLSCVENEVSNVRIVQCDAVSLFRDRILDASLSRIQIFFPDPWPKKRHHKRRLIQSNFIAALRQKLCVGGMLHCATDWEDYAMHMMSVLTHADGFKNHMGEHQFADNTVMHLRPNTKFEQRGVHLGHGVWDLLFKRIA